MKIVMLFYIFSLFFIKCLFLCLHIKNEVGQHQEPKHLIVKLCSTCSNEVVVAVKDYVKLQGIILVKPITHFRIQRKYFIQEGISDFRPATFS